MYRVEPSSSGVYFRLVELVFNVGVLGGVVSSEYVIMSFEYVISFLNHVGELDFSTLVVVILLVDTS